MGRHTSLCGIFSIWRTAAAGRDLLDRFSKWQTDCANFSSGTNGGKFNPLHRLRRCDSVTGALWCIARATVVVACCTARGKKDQKSSASLQALACFRRGFFDENTCLVQQQVLSPRGSAIRSARPGIREFGGGHESSSVDGAEPGALIIFKKSPEIKTTVLNGSACSV